MRALWLGNGFGVSNGEERDFWRGYRKKSDKIIDINVMGEREGTESDLVC